jgi:DNA mismatch endonuclease (patch repair protein)
MADTLTPAERSERMSRIRGKDTKPELAVRRIVHGLGYRYRLHRNDLPGKPDIVLPRHRAVIFVHGCFWHRHEQPSCTLARMPKSRFSFWQPKLEANRLRDVRTKQALEAAGWRVLVIWECEVKDPLRISGIVREFLGDRGS